MSKVTYLYLCDGEGCKRNCAESGFDVCHHTKDENHAKNKVRRNRKFTSMNDIMYEIGGKDDI